jgi:hypothetical protein
MFTMAVSRRGKTRRKAVRLVALLGTLIVMSVAVNALTILADSHLRQPAGWNGAAYSATHS